MDPVSDTGRQGPAHVYGVFALQAAHNLSDSYAEWAESISTDSVMLELLGERELERAHPTLVFAAIRAAGIAVAPWAEIRDYVVRRWPEILGIVRTHSTQTNEAARCAVLLPVLAQIPGPLALIEVGASAGLCLLPDRYSYRYLTAEGEQLLDPADGASSVMIDCAIEGIAPPSAIPQIVWRAGLDLNPLDIRDEETVRWLEALVWPEHHERADRLVAAAGIAADNPVRIVRGDAVDDLAALVAEAPADATVVVFHTAVLAYLTDDDRRRFVETVTALGVRWISNEGITVTPGVRERLEREPDSSADFVVALDGDPVAFASGHGRWVHFFG